MWKEIGLIGRDRFLKRDIYPRVKKNKGFFLTGKRGMGKSAILEHRFSQLVKLSKFLPNKGTRIISIASHLHIKLRKENYLLGYRYDS
jgi:hypothetical protein